MNGETYDVVVMDEIGGCFY